MRRQRRSGGERARRFGRGRLALSLSLALGLACSDGTGVERADGLVPAVVTGPTVMSAVVIDFTGVSEMDVEGGDAFTSLGQGGVVRAVIVLHEPDEVRLLLTPTTEGVKPTATLVDVADADYEPANPGAYSVLVGS